MARYTVRFFDKDLECESKFICVDAIKPKNEEGFIQIILDDQKNKSFRHIWLDISTAIKFAKTLRTEINKAKEVDNG